MGVYKLRGSFPGELQENLPFVIPVFPVNGVPTRVKGLDGWPETNYERKVKFQVTLMESALELCRQGRCAGYFPSFVIEAHNEKYRREFHLERHPFERHRKRCYSDVYLVKRKDHTESELMKSLAKMLRLGTKSQE
jgi:DNA-binding transcriptional LysR family regulator